MEVFGGCGWSLESIVVKNQSVVAYKNGCRFLKFIS
jgi:hypothetical protein